jgi:hypothetical protein
LFVISIPTNLGLYLAKQTPAVELLKKLTVLEAGYTMAGFARPIRKGHLRPETNPSGRKDSGAKNGTVLKLLPSRRSRLDDRRKSWSVCSHLSHPDRLLDYYMGSGSIMVLLGKCFCHECYEMVLSRRDLKEFMASCQHMTDQMFQENFIDPLIQINREVFRTKRKLTGEDTTQWTWIGCPHVSKEGQLESLYTGCDPVFFYEGFVTCNDCIEVVPTASLYLQTLLECEAMTDDQLQDRVIDQLYPINRTTMEAVRHYKR